MRNRQALETIHQNYLREQLLLLHPDITYAIDKVTGRPLINDVPAKYTDTYCITSLNYDILIYNLPSINPDVKINIMSSNLPFVHPDEPRYPDRKGHIWYTLNFTYKYADTEEEYRPKQFFCDFNEAVHKAKILRRIFDSMKHSGSIKRLNTLQPYLDMIKYSKHGVSKDIYIYNRISYAVENKYKYKNDQHRNMVYNKRNNIKIIGCWLRG